MASSKSVSALDNADRVPGAVTTGDRGVEVVDTAKVLSPLARKAPSLYDFQTGKWNRKFLCVSAVYRLLKRGYVGKARALELLATQHSTKDENAAHDR